MKTLIITLLTAASIMITANLCYSQVGIGTKTPDANSVLDVNSNTTTTTLTVDKDGNTRIGDVAAGNTTYIEADGSLSYEGTATRWDDLKVPMSSTRRGAAEDPLFDKFKDDGSGSVGVYVSWFRTNQTEDLFFDVQMPHAWKEGTTIYPHIHWAPKTDTGGQKVRWGFEFIWVNVTGTFGNTTIIYAEDPIAAVGTSPTAYQHVISAFPAIDATGQSLSSMLVCRIFRDGPHTNDSYTNSAALLEFDFHYQIDADGSRQEYIK